MIQLWDLRHSPDACQPRTLKHQNGDIKALAFSPDGRMLASGGSDHVVRLWWDLHKSDIFSRILGHHNKSVNSVTFNWNGTFLASGSDDSTIKLWNPETQSNNEPRATLTGHEGAIKTVAFSPDKKNNYMLASGGNDHRIRLWDIRQPDHSLKTLEGHRDIIYSVNFSPDGQMLASGSEDQTIRIWNIRNLEHLDIEAKMLGKHMNSVQSVVFSPDGQMLASGSEDQRVCLWRISLSDHTNPKSLTEPVRVIKGHDYGVSTLAFNRDKNNPLLASGSWDNTIRLWQLSPSKVTSHVIGKHKDNIMSVAVSPDGHWLVSGGWDKTVRLKDLRQPNAEPKIIGNHDDKVFAVAFDQNSQMLATAGADRRIKLWRDFKNPKKEPEILSGHHDGVSSVAFSSDGRWLASGSWSSDATVRLWDLQNPDASGQIVGKILWHHKNFNTHRGESVTSVAFSKNGQMLASSSDDKTIKLLDLRRTNGLSWDSIYEKSSSDSLENPFANPITLEGHKSRIWSIEFSPNSNMLASGSDDRTVRLWNLSQVEEDPKVLKVLEEHNFWVGSVTFSPDGQKIASGSYDKTIGLWDLNHLDETPIVLRGHEQSVTSVAFYPDGSKLVSGSYDNTIRTWIIGTKILADMVCEKVQRNLTHKEWKWFMGIDIPYEKSCPNLPPSEGTSEKMAQVEGLSKLEHEFQVKLAKVFPRQKAILEFIKQKVAFQADIAEDDISTLLDKPKADEGTYYRLETLRLLGFLEVTDKGQGPGTIRYGLSPKYQEYLSRVRKH